MKLFVSWYNRFEIFEDFQLFVYCRRSCSWKIVWIDHFSKDSLRWCSVECNVHINSRICVNIDALIDVTLILLTWRKCSFHRVIDLMLQEFLSIAMISISNISHKLHQSSKYKYFYSHRKSDKKSLFWSETQNAKQFSHLDQFASKLSNFRYFQMIYHII